MILRLAGVDPCAEASENLAEGAAYRRHRQFAAIEARQHRRMLVRAIGIALDLVAW